jgi:ribulose-5-phosphate 4-epimerase/fuculose-1-phosphate aldolase
VSHFLSEKECIISTSLKLVQDGILMTTGGNLSTRTSDGDNFAITPSNTDYTKMKPEDICICDFKGEQLEGRLRPSVESGMHAAIYHVRTDVHAIIHTHQIYSSTLALIDKAIPALFDEQVRFLGRDVKVIPYAPSGTGMLRDKIARNVRDHANAYLMKNHGALVFGTDMARAVLNVKLLEKCAITYLLALSTGEKVTKIPMWVREIAVQKLRKDQKRAEEDHKE